MQFAKQEADILDCYKSYSGIPSEKGKIKAFKAKQNTQATASFSIPWILLHLLSASNFIPCSILIQWHATRGSVPGLQKASGGVRVDPIMKIAHLRLSNTAALVGRSTLVINLHRLLHSWYLLPLLLWAFYLVEVRHIIIIVLFRKSELKMNQKLQPT